MNLKAVLEGILFVVGEEGITINKVEEILEIDIMSWENRALLYTSYCIRNIL